MPTWDDLLHFVCHQVLRTFCADLVADLKALHKTIRGRVHRKLTECAMSTPEELSSAEEPALEWPPAPRPLTSFLSAVTTCQGFADLILNEIKFDGSSTADLLKETQFSNVKDMSDLVYNDFFEPFGMLINFNGERVDDLPTSCYLPEVGLYYEVAGCFWKNPEFAKSFYMASILQFSSRRSYQLLLPHLGPWIQYRHAVDPCPYPKWPCRLCYYAEDEDYMPGENEDAEDQEDQEMEEMEIDSEDVDDIKQNADEEIETMAETKDGGEQDEEEMENEHETYRGEGTIESNDELWVVDCFKVEIVPKVADLSEFGTLDPPALNQDPSTGREQPLRSLADVDIATSPPGQWSIMFPLSEGHKKAKLRDDLQWFLVNYEEERMYVGPFACEALVWKGRDIWDVST
jgi:hypothetical protein